MKRAPRTLGRCTGCATDSCRRRSGCRQTRNPECHPARIRPRPRTAPTHRTGRCSNRIPAAASRNGHTGAKTRRCTSARCKSTPMRTRCCILVCRMSRSCAHCSRGKRPRPCRLTTRTTALKRHRSCETAGRNSHTPVGLRPGSSAQCKRRPNDSSRCRLACRRARNPVSHRAHTRLRPCKVTNRTSCPWSCRRCASGCRSCRTPSNARPHRTAQCTRCSTRSCRRRSACRRGRSCASRSARIRLRPCTRQSQTTRLTRGRTRARENHTCRKPPWARLHTPARRTGPIRSCRRRLVCPRIHSSVFPRASTRAARSIPPTPPRSRCHTRAFACRNARKRGWPPLDTSALGIRPSDNRRRRSARRPSRTRASARRHTRPRSRTHRIRPTCRPCTRALGSRTSHTI